MAQSRRRTAARRPATPKAASPAQKALLHQKPEKPKKKAAPKKEPAKANGKKKDIDKEIEKGLKIAYANRKKGKVQADKANKVRHSVCDVYVYLVDDNALQLKVMQEQFKNTKSFKNTVAFKSAEDLFKYIQQRKYAKRSIILVVMDYNLENSENEDAMTGLEALTALKAYDPDIEVVMLSSHDDVDIVSSASHFGAVTFVKKGDEAFRKVVNNMVWTIRDKEITRKKMESKSFVKLLIYFLVIVFASIIIAGYFIPELGIFKFEEETEEVTTKPPAATPAPIETAPATPEATDKQQ